MKLSLKSEFVFFYLLVLLTISCKKNPTDSITDPVKLPLTEEVPAFDKQLTTASVQGFIVQEGGFPVYGALVTCGEKTALTDVRGYFGFHNIQLSKNNGFIKVTKEGYFTGSRSFLTNSERNNQVRIQLIPKQNSGNINATAGGTVSLSNGITVALPAKAVVKAADSSVYTGTVNLAIAWIDPTSTKLTEQMPGDLRGITTAGDENVLKSFGMAAVELTGSGGELLQIAPGKKATLSFSIPAKLSAAAPTTIALWYFSETIGRWKQSGIATKIGDKYVGDVTHFSFWNCDIGVQLINFDATIVSSSGQPLAYTTVAIVDLSGTTCGIGNTDSVGYISGKIPVNETLAIGIVSPCTGVLISQNIGPFATNTSLGTITVNTLTNPFFVTISGKLVDCNSIGIPNGQVFIKLGGESYYTEADSTGNFSKLITNCNRSSSFTIYGMNAMNSSAIALSEPLTKILNANNNVGNLNACIDTSVYLNINVKDSMLYIPLLYHSTSTDLFYPSHFEVSPFSNADNNIVTTVKGYIQSVGTSKSIGFSFEHPGAASPGTYLIKSYSSSTYNPNFSFTGVITENPMVTITKAFGNVGDYVEGYFTIPVVELLGPGTLTPIPLTCNFRIKRTN
jgi:hypothetical protein